MRSLDSLEEICYKTWAYSYPGIRSIEHTIRNSPQIYKTKLFCQSADVYCLFFPEKMDFHSLKPRGALGTESK